MSSTNINDTESGEILRTIKLLKKAYKDCKRDATASNYNKKWSEADEKHLKRVAEICVDKNIEPGMFMRLAFKHHFRQIGPWLNELWNHKLVGKVVAELDTHTLVLKRVKKDGDVEEIKVGLDEYRFAGQVSNILVTLSKYIGAGVMKDAVHDILLNPGFNFHPVAVYIVGYENEEVKASVKQEAIAELKNDKTLPGSLQLLGYGYILGELKGE